MVLVAHYLFKQSFNMRLAVVFALLFCVRLINAQDLDVPQVVEKILNQQDEEQRYEDLLNNLTDLSKTNPIKINGASKEDLEQLFFLSDKQIEEILYSQYIYGDFATPYQLQRVNGLDSTTIKLMNPFLSYQPSEQKSRYRIGSQILARSSSQLASNQTSNTNYLGDQTHNLLRIKVFDNKSNDFGLTLEKDPGESYFTNQGFLTDYYSFYFQTKSRGILKNLIVGDYNLSFGQGLVMGYGLMVGKSSNSLNIRAKNGGAFKHSSSAENGFLRGASAIFKHRNFENSSFISLRKLDAKIVFDSLKNSSFATTLYETGLHRTESELQYKEKLIELVYGTAFKASYTHISLETGLISTSYSYPFQASTELYRRFSTLPQSMYNVFFNGRGFYLSNQFFGEFALNQDGEKALTIGLISKPSEQASIAILFRSISKGYTAPRLNTFSESSSPQGETGVYVGAKMALWNRCTMNSSIDLFKYEWLKYGVDAPSKGYEWMVNLEQQLSSAASTEIRIKGSTKEMNSIGIDLPFRVLTEEHLHTLKAAVRYELLPNLEMRSSYDASFSKSELYSTSKGMVLSQDFRLSLFNGLLATTARVQLFDVDDYRSRIYLYEPDLLYCYSSHQFLGRGERVVGNFVLKPTDWATISFRIAQTRVIEPNSESSSIVDGRVQVVVKW